MIKMWLKSKKKALVVIGSFLAIVAILAFAYLRDNALSINAFDYNLMLKNKEITKAYISKNYVYLYTERGAFKIPKEIIDIQKLSEKAPVEVKKDLSVLYDLIFLILFIAFLIYFFYYGKQLKEQPMIKHQISISQPEIDNFSSTIKPILSNIKFKDVAGIEDVKEELYEIIQFLKNPKKFSDFGIRKPKGVLLVGPPGVGKTLVAKAAAGEANVPFFYQSGSSFVQIYVGIGAKRVRELFAKAKQMSPSIIFIDEIDAVGKARGGFRSDEREATLNQLLIELDGFEESNEIVVIGATNKIEMLDEALLRPGRFDRRVFISLPNAREMEEIIKIYLKKIPSYIDTKKLSKMTTGFSGAALSNLVNEAALNAMRKGKKIVQMDDFEDVIDKVLYGKKRMLAITEREKEIQALYQAAKVVTAYWYEIDFDKITLLGDGFKEPDKEILSKHQFLSRLKLHLSGYVAMKLFYEEEFSNAAKDLKLAKMLAEEMVSEYGMGKRIVSDIKDIAEILEIAQKETKEFLLSQNRLINKIKEFLIDNEAITYEDTKKILAEIF